MRIYGVLQKTLMALTFVAFVMWNTNSPGMASHLDAFQSPAPTPEPTSESPIETQVALEYIAAREAIPVGQLIVVNQHERKYEALGKTYWYVKVFDSVSRHFYKVLVDLSDRTPVEYMDVEGAQAKAMIVTYGKLAPELHDLLQSKGPDDGVNVAVSFTPVDFEALLTQLRAKYPKVSLDLPERPWWSVNDRSLSEQIEADYFLLLQEAHLAKQKDLAEWLGALGYTVKLHQGTLSLVARLPKHLILEVTQRDDVTRLDLVEGKLNLLLDHAIPTAKGNLVWQRGITGAASKIAIIEPGEVNLLHWHIDVKEVRFAADQNPHTSWVASAAASSHPTLPGMAPGADIYSAGVDEQADQWDDVDDAILWAWNRGCRIMNASFTSDAGERTDRMQWIDRVFDHFARYYGTLITVAAGNQEQGNHIGSPAKGYNVIAVGGTNDNDTALWQDDVMWPNSSWKNPMRGNNTYGDREKPEVVASAYGLTLLGNNGSPIPDLQGTSYSSPQVAGMAALLLGRNDSLQGKPEALRAIIMASALHNVDGPRGIPTGVDLKDGAGAIDAGVADQIAVLGYYNELGYPYPACQSPCWWSNPIDWTHFPAGTSRYYDFTATRGERIRVALTWDSLPTGSYTTDLLATDLDLAVFAPGGGLPEHAYSASNDNSYELVDFVAPETGVYRIGVYKAYATTESFNWLGLAWTRDATYLPDVRSAYNGWE